MGEALKRYKTQHDQLANMYINRNNRCLISKELRRKQLLREMNSVQKSAVSLTSAFTGGNGDESINPNFTLKQHDRVRYTFNSQHRNASQDPFPNDFTVSFPESLLDVKRVSIESVTFSPRLYNINETNNCLYFSEKLSTDQYAYYYRLRIPPGFYATIADVLTTINNMINTAEYIPCYNVGGFVQSPVSRSPQMTYNFAINSLSSKNITVYGTASNYTFYIHCPPLTEFLSPIVKISSVSKAVVGSVDYITVITKEVSNVCDNGMFHLNFVGSKGHSLQLTNVVAQNHGTDFLGYGNITNRKIGFPITLGSWPFDADEVVSGTITPIASEDNISRILGFCDSGTATINPILGVASVGGYARFLVKYPMNNSTTSVIVPQSSPTTVETVTITNNFLVQTTGLSLATPHLFPLSDTSYLYATDTYIGESIPTFDACIDIYIRVTVNSNVDIGGLIHPKTGTKFLACIKYIGATNNNTTFNISSYLPSLGEDILQAVVEKINKIQFRLYRDDGSPLLLEHCDDYRLTISFLGSQ